MPIPTTRESVQRSLLRDDVYTRLRDAIVDGTLAPGEQLRDGDLADWLGVSRTPVREALQRLARAGLVHTTPGRSTTVATLDRRDIRNAQAVVAAMHRLAVEEAVGQLTAADLDAMRAANDRFADAVRRGDVDAALAADDDFHGIPVAAAANTAIETVLDQFTPVLRRLERLRFASLTGRASVALHARLVDLCEAGDTEAAARVSQETWETLQPLLDSLAARRRPPDPDDRGHAMSLHEFPRHPLTFGPSPVHPLRPPHRAPRRCAGLGQARGRATAASPSAATRSASSSTSSPTSSPRAPTPSCRSAASSPTTPARSPPSRPTSG